MLNVHFSFLPPGDKIGFFRRCVSRLALPLLASVALNTASAQSYPTQPIRLVVPFSAGGGADATARVLAEQLGRRLGQPIVVENRPGASAGVGALAVAHATPNGYTLLVGTSTLATNSLLLPTPGLDIVKDFEFIGQIGRIDLLLVVSPQLKVSNLRGFLDMMRSQPDKLTFGSPGTGSGGHLGVELFKLVTKTRAVHIPYKGDSAALADLIGGHTNFQMCAPVVCAPRIQDGSLKALGIASKHRSKLLPNVPTLAEEGVAGVEAGAWWYLAAPKGTPADIINKLNTALNQVTSNENYRSRQLAIGVETESSTTPAAVRDALLSEIEKWRPVVKAAVLGN
ncbi:Bug family tripartite tricarboxylate transporter substrate binding protein [Cupriavidus pinatubonensis]|uniref:Bug family tripartite tricarboxylate transporter substrate binding protein n=1 Tax=Cupriavidus pinatubonensis TaxID=248026 RepID=UPI00112BF45A|nr:tripartite tricarboxylate transporter substrate binding protein [Cupriavidus pinatubonensis]TPQ39772.1 hypothetical protein C2U69_11335 [Cupriavidus pinatubonensis]